MPVIFRPDACKIEFGTVLCQIGVNGAAMTSKPTTKTKFASDTLLFKPEPPVLRKHVKSLFCGRSQELARGLESLKRNLDINGKRSRQHDKRPWVIHGESRIGKSHLARRIFAELPNTKTRIQCVVQAREKFEAVVVMRMLFETFRGDFGNRTMDQSLPADFTRKVQVQLVNQLIEKIALFDGGADSATLTVEEAAKQSLDVGIEAGGAPKLLKFIAKYQTERSEKQSIQVSLRPPTALDLAQIVGIMAEALLSLRLINHFLVLVDDVDLLEGYASAQQNARRERSLLADALDELHGTPGVDVVLTARSWYAHTRKEFQTLVDLAESEPMRPEDLTEIHDRRFKLYAGKRGPQNFLSRAALMSVANDVEGLPGVFIQHLETAFYQYQSETDWGERDYDWFLNVFRRRFEAFREKCSPAAEALEQAIHAGKPHINVTSGNPFIGTVFDNEFVYQSYYSETTYFTSGLMRKIVGIHVPEGIAVVAETDKAI